MTLTDIENFGIIGAGGAGFPAHVKLSSPAEILILNAVECEPLLHKDKEILRTEPETVLKGFRLSMTLTGSREGVIAVKEKYGDLIRLLKPLLPPSVRIAAIGDFYPAGDEVTLIHLVTSRIVQPGSLPGSVGCAVMNVETALNVGRGEAVTEKYLTVAGAVTEPATLRVPVGTAIGDILSLFKINERNYVAMMNGLMMGYPETDLDNPVTKRTGGIIVLPADHHCVETYRRFSDSRVTVRFAKTACDQCSFCTELCPRYLLGHPVRPEIAMRNRMFGRDTTANAGSLFCCECNLCTLFSCPEDLDPKGAILMEKKEARKQGLHWEGRPVRPHPMNAWRRTPVRKLMQRLGVAGYANTGALRRETIRPALVRLPLLQHSGAPAIPVVKPGQTVRKGDLIAKPGGKISAAIHASIDGTVEIPNSSEIIIKRRS